MPLLVRFLISVSLWGAALIRAWRFFWSESKILHCSLEGGVYFTPSAYQRNHGMWLFITILRPYYVLLKAPISFTYKNHYNSKQAYSSRNLYKLSFATLKIISLPYFSGTDSFIIISFFLFELYTTYLVSIKILT